MTYISPSEMSLMNLKLNWKFNIFLMVQRRNPNKTDLCEIIKPRNSKIDKYIDAPCQNKVLINIFFAGQ